ncbi:MAG: lipopolysaccharide biosynthesis protein [Firmicutes bacterium]|nr:lipopolysaccharide biosynthesis protein [Bacillota bacterium]
MESNLRFKSFQGAIWKTVERLGSQLVLFIIGIILARILSPAEFGLIGLLALFIAVAQEFVDSGFSTSLIRNKDAKDIDFTTIFWFNLTVSVIVYLILFSFAGFIASFYDEPILKNLTRVLTINLIINALGSTQRIHYIRKIDFKTQAKVNLFAIIIGGVVGIAMALNGFGVWALVGKNLTQTIIINGLFWFYSSWYPTFDFSIAAFKENFKFGSKLLMSGLLSSVTNHFYSLIIGKAFSPESLGYYNRAKQFQELPVATIQGVGINVLFPVMSKVQDDIQKLKFGYRTFLKIITYLLTPVMFAIIILAEPIVLILLTDKWLPVVPMLQILAINGMLTPFHSINVNVLLVKGRSDLVLYLDIMKIIAMFINVAISVQIGVLALVWGIVIQSVIFLFINIHFSYKVFKYNLLEQLNDVKTTFFVSFILFVSMFLLSNLFENNLYTMVLTLVGGSVLYLSIGYFFKLNEFLEIKRLIFSLLSKRK